MLIDDEDDLLAFDAFPPTTGRASDLAGVPGTGTTHALRALAWEWREWCELHYVTDPEQLFGGRTDYLMDVVLEQADEDKWRLLVLEDTGELLAADAKERTRQGLLRLLNVVDGIIARAARARPRHDERMGSSSSTRLPDPAISS